MVVLIVVPEMQGVLGKRGEQADWLVERLAPLFPGARFIAAPDYEQAKAHFHEAQVFVGTGLGMTAEMVARMERLQWIQCLLSGTDQLRPALDGHGDILLTSVRGIHGPQMSEMALLHMLSLNRGAGRLHRNQSMRRWERAGQHVLERKTVGIVGMGAVGARLAKVCKAFAMTVWGVSRSGRAVEGVDRVFSRSELHEVARQADFLVVVVAREPETDNLVGEEVFAVMKPTAFVVNLSRGGIVDEEALADALRGGQIAGAGLDVFATEPLPVESPLWDFENVFITPHLGGLSDHYGDQVLTVVEPNLRHFLAGELARLKNVV